MLHIRVILFSPGCRRTFEECLLDMQVLPSKTKLQRGVSSEGWMPSQILNSAKARLDGREGGPEGLRVEIEEGQGNIFKV